MIFKAVNKKEFEKVATCYIAEHIELKDFINEEIIKKQILTCPTNAIDTENKEITQDCIDCGICWIKYPSLVSKIKEVPSLPIFKAYLKKDKMFIYKWIALCIEDLAGINIKSKGFSRVKRIPLVVKTRNQLYFVKSIYDIADFEKADYELDDIIQLIQEDFQKYQIKKIIVVINGVSSKMRNKSSIITFDELYDKIINQNKRKIMELVG